MQHNTIMYAVVASQDGGNRLICMQYYWLHGTLVFMSYSEYSYIPCISNNTDEVLEEAAQVTSISP